MLNMLYVQYGDTCTGDEYRNFHSIHAQLFKRLGLQPQLGKGAQINTYHGRLRLNIMKLIVHRSIVAIAPSVYTSSYTDPLHNDCRPTDKAFQAQARTL